MIQQDPSQRLTASGVLNHPWMTYISPCSSSSSGNSGDIADASNATGTLVLDASIDSAVDPSITPPTSNHEIESIAHAADTAFINNAPNSNISNDTNRILPKKDGQLDLTSAIAVKLVSNDLQDSSNDSETGVKSVFDSLLNN